MRSKNLRTLAHKSNSTKIKYGYKQVKFKAQTMAYNQPIYLSNNALKYEEQIKRNLEQSNSTKTGF